MSIFNFLRGKISAILKKNKLRKILITLCIVFATLAIIFIFINSTKISRNQSNHLAAQTASNNKSVADKTVTDKTVVDKTVADKTVTDKTVTDKTVTDKTVTDKTVADKAVADKAVADKAVADKAVADKAAADKAAADKAAADKVVADKVAADKAAADIRELRILLYWINFYKGLQSQAETYATNWKQKASAELEMKYRVFDLSQYQLFQTQANHYKSMKDKNQTLFNSFSIQEQEEAKKQGELKSDSSYVPDN